MCADPPRSNWKPGTISSVTTAPPTLPPFDEYHLVASFSQYAAADECIVPRTDDDHIAVSHVVSSAYALVLPWDMRRLPCQKV